jgi:hypothetical protein
MSQPNYSFDKAARMGEPVQHVRRAHRPNGDEAKRHYPYTSYSGTTGAGPIISAGRRSEANDPLRLFFACPGGTGG